MLSDRGRDLLISAISIVAALSVLVASLAYRPASAYFPQLLAVFIAVMALAFGWRRLREPAASSVGGDADADKAALRAFVKVVVGILAYTGAMMVVGFALATVLFLALSMLALGARRWIVILAVAIGLAALLHFLFFWFLGVYPPEAMISF